MFANSGQLVSVPCSFHSIIRRHCADDTAVKSNSDISSSVGVSLIGFPSRIPLSVVPFPYKVMVFLKMT
jgi:hypothetical protein